MNIITEYYNKLIDKLVKTSGVDRETIELLTTFDRDKGTSHMFSRCQAIEASSLFSRIYNIANARHLVCHKLAVPKYDRNVLQDLDKPVAISVELNGKPTCLSFETCIALKLTERTFKGYKFSCHFEDKDICFIVVPELYPWLLVPATSKVAAEYSSIKVGVNRLVILNKSTMKLLSVSRVHRLRFLSLNYSEICSILENMNSFIELSGPITDLKEERNYPKTHKSPSEHIRHEHIRHCKSGKNVVVHATVVCAGR